jgi:hypothetical protein
MKKQLLVSRLRNIPEICFIKHPSPVLTNKIYTNVDPVPRLSINQLPIKHWLKK